MMSSKHHEQYVTVPGYQTLSPYGVWSTLGRPYRVKTEETYVGQSNPKWKALIEAHKSATNSLEATKSFLEVRPHHVDGYFQSVNNKWYPGGISGWYGGLVLEYNNVAHLPEALDKARVEFLSKISTEISPFKGLVFLGELKETARMIHSTARSLLTDMSEYVARAKRFLRNTRKRGRRALDYVNGMYLEATYGWTPLIGEIGSFCDALRSDRVRPVYLRGKGFAEAASAQNFLTGAFIGRDLKWSDVRRTKTRAMVVGVLLKTLPGSKVQEYSETFGLRLAEFVPTLWELVPYSFVSDYFFNIGDVLSTAFVETSNVAWYSATQKTTATKVVKLQGHQQGDSFQSVVAVFEPGELRQGVKHISRSVPTLSVSLDFTLNFDYPDIGSRRYLNMASLLLQKLK